MTKTPGPDDDRFWRAQAERVSYPAGKHWFCIRSNIKCEYRAQKGLAALGYRTFLPQRTKWVSHARVRTIVKRPLMCRYFFAEIDPSKQGFGEVRLVDGVESIVGTTGTPVVIPAEFVMEFISREMAGEFNDAAKEPILRGARVKIVSGQWDELFGIVTGGAIKDGLGSVMVQFLGQRASAKLNGYAVRAVTRGIDERPKISSKAS